MNTGNFRRSPTQVAEALATAEELFERGQTLNQIATTLGITTMTLYRWRRKHNSLAEFATRTDFDVDMKSETSSDLKAAGLSLGEKAVRDASIDNADQKSSIDRRSSSDALTKELRWLRRLAAELLLKNQRLEAELRGELDP